MPTPKRTLIALAATAAALAGGTSVGLAQSGDGSTQTTPSATTPEQQRTTPESAPQRDGGRGPCPEKDGSANPDSSVAPSSGDAPSGV